MYRAYAELSRLMGFYGQPAAKREKWNAESDALSAQFESYSDEQLLAIIAGKSTASTA
jgi:hypothetical protein